jgi:hypothetical protein
MNLKAEMVYLLLWNAVQVSGKLDELKINFNLCFTPCVLVTEHLI